MHDFDLVGPMEGALRSTETSNHILSANRIKVTLIFGGQQR